MITRLLEATQSQSEWRPVGCCQAVAVSETDESSKRTRVEPAFGWLSQHGEPDWPARLLTLAEGLKTAIEPGEVGRLDYLRERRVPPSARRLAWMVRNADRLAPREGRRWREYRQRVTESPRREPTLEKLDRGETNGIDRKLILEGSTSADCLIECSHAVIWIEGKRNDWLDYSTTWDVTRDQLARNAEAAWQLGLTLGKDSCVLICHEHRLKHHEELLIDGYRRGTWAGGWPHMTVDERTHLGDRIGTIRWDSLARQWPAIGSVLC